MTTEKRRILAWAFYDWGNSAFATTVMAVFFPIFFKSFWSDQNNIGESTFQLGTANSMIGLMLAFTAPFLGAIADQWRAKKIFLGFFACFGILCTAGFFFISAGEWMWAIGFYVLSSIGFFAGNIFYDSLVVSVSPPRKIDMVSSLGFALGYLGGGLLFLINTLMVQFPQWFGLADASAAVRWSFLTVALWWGLFSIPLFLWVPEPGVKGRREFKKALRLGLQEIWHTFQHIRRLKPLVIFLLAYLFYIDGVNTIVKMAVDYGMSLGFEQKHLIQALLLTQFIGFPAAVAFGFIGQKWGSKPGIVLGLLVYIGVNIYAYFLNSVAEFYILAVVIGLVQGGVQSLSRSLYGKMIPPEKAGEFFGFFNMLGKFSSFIGPFFVGWVSLKTGSPRLSILVILILFGLGLTILTFVPKPKPAT